MSSQPPPIQPAAFTTFFSQKSTVLYNQVKIAFAISQAMGFREFRAIWDTGAEATVVTERVVSQCGLKPTGMRQIVTASGVQDAETYNVSLLLPNKVSVKGLRVSKVRKLSEGTDVLIGMDIIGLGDFAVSARDGETVFTFRIPSIERIDFTTGLPRKRISN